jgi:GT2 family glycosyltransferase
LKVTALIIGIDGWEQYTFPLIQSLQQSEPQCKFVVVDNASNESYPKIDLITRTERLAYSKAINWAKSAADQLYGESDWYIVLSNDVLCTGEFVEYLASLQTNQIVGPCLKENQSWQYLEGWCVAIPKEVWDRLGGWDENFKVSSWEDVDFSTSTLSEGFDILHYPEFPFIHLDQRQRFTLIPNYWESEYHNYAYFLEKHKNNVHQS